LCNYFVNYFLASDASSVYFIAMPSTLRTRFTTAFSLIEVTLSLGVVSFALLSLLALLPLGLKMMQEAQQQQAIGNILLEARGQAQQMSSTDIVGGTGVSATIFYDINGSRELGSIGGGFVAMPNVYYSVVTQRVKPSVGSASTLTSFNTNYSTGLQVTIVYPMSKTSNPAAIPGAKTNTYVIFAARQSGS
jgi:uncharacterized protein (TIGR02598 family)